MTNTTRCTLAIVLALSGAAAVMLWMDARRPEVMRAPVAPGSPSQPAPYPNSYPAVANDSAARLEAAQKGFDASLKRFNTALDNYIQVQRAYDLNVGHKALSDSRHVFLSDCKEGPTNPCLFRFGDLVVVETMSYTITAHSGTGKVYVYETMAGIVVGYGEGFQPGAISGTGATFGIDEPASPAVSLFVCDVRDGKWQTCKMPKEFK